MVQAQALHTVFEVGHPHDYFPLFTFARPVSISAELVAAVRYFEQRQTQVQQQSQHQSEEVRERLAFLELQAQVGTVKRSLNELSDIAYMTVLISNVKTESS